jgi:osmotically-inducible protein OsmY
MALPAFPVARRAILSIPLLAGAALLVALAGCSPAGVAVGAGAGAGIGMAQERGLKQAAEDVALSAQVVDHWLAADINLPTILSVEVWESRALITGSVEHQETADMAIKLAWQVKGLKDVYNEIQVGRHSGIADMARDSWITAQLKSKLTLDKDVYAINYSIETVNGIVYLIGAAQSPAELARVRAHADGLKYVKDVISHVRVIDPNLPRP